MGRFDTKLLVISLVVLLLCGPMDVLAQEKPGIDNADSQTHAPARSDVNSKGALPESPGAVQNTNQEVTPATIPSPKQANGTQQPSGAAAAPAPKVSGNAVSRPAGSAIAPPKQRQVRSFLIKIGLIAGAGVAVGTVLGLSSGSPSRPPGSH